VHDVTGEDDVWVDLSGALMDEPALGIITLSPHFIPSGRHVGKSLSDFFRQGAKIRPIVQFDLFDAELKIILFL